MGEFRRGKSSLINALLGLNVLPSDVTPTTATINRITFGTEPKATIHFMDGRKSDINISELQSYVTKLTEENEKTALSIREAVIYYPTVICQNHVDIIDTPGLNDDETMTRTTINILNDIDAVIVTVSALFPYSETEKTLSRS
jgi:predicted GTPase